MIFLTFFIFESNLREQMIVFYIKVFFSEWDFLDLLYFPSFYMPIFFLPTCLSENWKIWKYSSKVAIFLHTLKVIWYFEHLKYLLPMLIPSQLLLGTPQHPSFIRSLTFPFQKARSAPANMWHGRENSGGSWPPVFPCSYFNLKIHFCLPSIVD